MDLLFFWTAKNYQADLRQPDRPLHLHQSSKRMHSVEAGESVWAFTRNAAGTYVLAAELVVIAKEVLSQQSAHGQYRVLGDPARSRFFDTSRAPDAEPIIRSVCGVTAPVLGSAFQGRGAVKPLSPDGTQETREFASGMVSVPWKELSLALTKRDSNVAR